MFYDMHNCFKKINNRLRLNESVSNVKSNLHMSHDKWQKYGLALKNIQDFEPSIALTYEVTDQTKSLVLSTIPTELTELETPQVWYLEVTGTNDVTTMVPPHVDKFRICTINYYIQTSGENTYFYEYKSGIMEEISSFCAKTNECWILNTTVPHSVKLNVGETRRVIGASFITTPFEKVISFFP